MIMMMRRRWKQKIANEREKGMNKSVLIIYCV